MYFPMQNLYGLSQTAAEGMWTTLKPKWNEKQLFLATLNHGCVLNNAWIPQVKMIFSPSQAIISRKCKILTKQRSGSNSAF